MKTSTSALKAPLSLTEQPIRALSKPGHWGGLGDSGSPQREKRPLSCCVRFFV